jgi:acetyl-CoA/propionyl-CoA carboxylase, biotin carboxylase, biotin carboxyl carrier protein
VGYRGAGTVEFLLDRDSGIPAFLEMNTRLQVEHGVTELVTGVDLVVAQLRIAAGETLGAVLGTVEVRGHAIQARIAAEDPWEDFRPAPGRITALTPPSGPWLRCDLGVEAGDAVPGEYDSLLGKVLAWAPDRATACARLAGALDDLVVTGVPTTAPYLRAVLDRPDHAAMDHDTRSVERDWPPDPDARPVPARISETTRTVSISTDRGPLALRIPRHRDAPPGVTSAAPRPERSGPTAGSAPTGDPVAPMDATVVDVVVAAGDDVEAGAVLVVLEAMKMELPVRAPAATRVDAVHVAPGDRVTAGSALVATSAPAPG